MENTLENARMDGGRVCVLGGRGWLEGFVLAQTRDSGVWDQGAGSGNAEQWREVKVIGLAGLDDYPIM